MNRAPRPFPVRPALRLRDGATLLALVAVSCGGPRIPDAAIAAAPRAGGHTGPAVDGDETGTNRFAQPLLSIFEAPAAKRVAGRLDGFARPPGSDGYEKAIDYLSGQFDEAGFGDEPGFSARVLETGSSSTWTPQAAFLSVVGQTPSGQVRRVKISKFARPGDAERAMLPLGSPSYEVAGTVVFDVEDITEGVILLTDQTVRSVEQEAAERGAAGVISTYLLPYAVDPTGEDRHFDAIFTGSIRPGSELPSMYVSPRTGENVRQAHRAGSTFEMAGSATTTVRPLRTIVAEIEGSEFPDQVVYVVTHADGYGANDNAAGAAGILELSRSIKRLVLSGTIERPRRTIRFVIGAESSAGEVILEELDGEPVCAIVADMIGQSYERTGAICLLERGWDPGGLHLLPPDQHTPWGAGEIVKEDIVPDGLAIVLREALVDVGGATERKGKPPWPTSEHPWEGGSDHDAFLDAGVPAALVWHFTDFSYATSLDRIEHVDAEELRRTSVAIGAAALAVADARMGDLERHLDTLNLERRVRLGAAERAGSDPVVADDWAHWFTGARLWLRALCAGEPLDDQRTLDEYGE
ncbi:MAG: M28 family peptidase [Planctomycetota bacterium]